MLKWDLNFDDGRKTAVLCKKSIGRRTLFVFHSSSHNFQSLTGKSTIC
ncbi:hypothetical protein LEP1GSC008_1039 [Leptospira kirschneri serovar Bulgarica str. Nikolaevo]|uniref:Uncharacterized protein n=1 Tax=Leptospira kirschneri serovar Bulgarica str. Nikolaevo TaxID=1240687 RepID=M6FJG5_9LEPT|nr:hypothetical protein LEP1GSC008_1039 [Leptospira kirschneri serovar Bulgarica str. Nikolaevo]